MENTNGCPQRDVFVTGKRLLASRDLTAAERHAAIADMVWQVAVASARAESESVLGLRRAG
jgi:hypothetical protein